MCMRVYNSYSYVDMPRRSGGQWGEKNIIKSTQAIASNGEMQQAFTANVKNDYIEIYNCYALESAVLKTDDYRANMAIKLPQSW